MDMLAILMSRMLISITLKRRAIRHRFALTMLVCAMLVCAMASTAVFSPAQTPIKTTTGSKADHYYEPLPQETGATGLKLMLRRLQTTAQLMHADAHPH